MYSLISYEVTETDVPAVHITDAGAIYIRLTGPFVSVDNPAVLCPPAQFAWLRDLHQQLGTALAQVEMSQDVTA